jgi:hypothetical protein
VHQRLLTVTVNVQIMSTDSTAGRRDRAGALRFLALEPGSMPRANEATRLLKLGLASLEWLGELLRTFALLLGCARRAPQPL